VDGRARSIAVSSLVEQLRTEWRDLLILSTVLLNANVAFLAIPSVDNGSNHRTPSQIASYMSVVASIGSIITGLLLIRGRRNAIEIDEFRRGPRGLKTWAIMYSLPYVLLMWAMICFLMAFLLECLLKPSDVLARIPVIIAWVSVGVLVLWCINTGWDREHPILLPFTVSVRSWMEHLR